MSERRRTIVAIVIGGFVLVALLVSANGLYR